ncbi:MAG TPA: DUF4193 family protein, partial [Acidimicrobiales bacterium]|nr:DUF4193 family protein [Acidimicrobiales bacterium]
ADDGDDLVDDDLAVDDEAADEIETPVGKVATDEEEDDEDEDDLDGDDVEATLDEILKERLVVQDEEEDEEEAPEPEDRTEGVGKVQPRQPGEFVCQSCFLVKHPSQLADEQRMYCRDCV